MSRSAIVLALNLFRSYPIHHQLEVFLGIPFVTAARALSVWAFTISFDPVDMHREGSR
jgi:hypothetical protein